MKLHYNEVKGDLLDIKPDKRKDVFNWGSDNSFPSLVEGLIAISATASSCIDKVKKAYYGGGFGKSGEIKVNSKQTLNKVYNLACEQLAKNNNVFILFGYNLDLEISSIQVISNKHCRLGKADDLDYSGKYIVYNNWDKSKGKIDEEDFKLIDAYNPSKGVIVSQMDANDVYFGQIRQVKGSEDLKYGISPLFPVLEECLLEHHSKIFRANGAKKGFLNNKLLTTKPFGDEDSLNAFLRRLKSATGVDGSGDVLLLEASITSDDLQKEIKLEDLTSSFDDKLFEYSDKVSQKQICVSTGVPLMLVNPENSSMFGNSGALLVEARKQLFEEKQEERDSLIEVFREAMSMFSKPIDDLQLVNPFENLNILGSDFVDVVLKIQQGIKEGKTSIESGVYMLVSVYGLTEEDAALMIGNPQKDTMNG